MADEANTSGMSADALQRGICDQYVALAANRMVHEAGATVETVIDRMLTYSVGQAVATFGKEASVQMLRLALKKVRAGAFDQLDHPPTKTVN